MQGLEYLNSQALSSWWTDLDALVRDQIPRRLPGGVQAYLSELNPQWRLVGRVTFHLAENKRDPEHPFAFLATYIPPAVGPGTHSMNRSARHSAIRRFNGSADRSRIG